MQLPNATRSAIVNVVIALIGAGGLLKFRTAADAVCAALGLANPAFGAAVNGVATAGTITPDTNAAGNASPFTKVTVETSAGVIVWTSTAGTTGMEVNMSAATIGAGDTVSINAGATLTQPAT